MVRRRAPLRRGATKILENCVFIHFLFENFKDMFDLGLSKFITILYALSFMLFNISWHIRKYEKYRYILFCKIKINKNNIF